MIQLAANFPGIDAWILKRIDKMACFMGQHHTLCAFSDDGDVLAAAAFDSFTPYECCVHVVVDERLGVTRGTLRQVFEYPFITCGFDRVTALVSSANARSIEFIQRLGFSLEGRKRKAIDGEDEIIYGMLKSECRWIR